MNVLRRLARAALAVAGWLGPLLPRPTDDRWCCAGDAVYCHCEGDAHGQR